MDELHRQQGFDTTVALFVKLGIPKGPPFSLIITIADIDDMIESQVLGETPLGKTLICVREHARANAYPESTKVRIGEYRSLAKNSTTRGNVGVVTGVKAKSNNETSKVPKGTPETTDRLKAILALKKAKKALSSAEIAEIIGVEGDRACQLLLTLTKEGKAKKRKAKESEKTCGSMKFVYEAAA